MQTLSITRIVLTPTPAGNTQCTVHYALSTSPSTWVLVNNNVTVPSNGFLSSALQIFNIPDGVDVTVRAVANCGGTPYEEEIDASTTTTTTTTTAATTTTTTAATTTTTTTEAPEINFTVTNTANNATITNVTPTVYDVQTGSFPLGELETLEAIHPGFDDEIAVTLAGSPDGTLTLRKNGSLVDSLPTSGGGIYTFNGDEYLAGDEILITLE